MVLKGLMYTGLYSSSVCSNRLHYLPSRLLWSNWLYYKAGDFYTLPSGLEYTCIYDGEVFIIIRGIIFAILIFTTD